MRKMLSLLKSVLMKPSPSALTSLVVSETGLVRKDNQDSCFADAAHRAYCVADGMGGGAEGAKASDWTCAAVRRAVRMGGTLAARMELVSAALQAANERICSYAQGRGYRQMGSTAALLIFDDAPSSPRTASLCWVGDSRIYRFRRGLAKQLTRDHTVGAELGGMIDKSRIEEFKSRSNPLAHVLTRAVGTAPQVRLEWARADVQCGDRFLICSDGVHDVVPVSRLGVLVGYGTLEKARERLAAEIVRSGAPDNYTFVLVEVAKGA